MWESLAPEVRNDHVYGSFPISMWVPKTAPMPPLSLSAPSTRTPLLIPEKPHSHGNIGSSPKHRHSDTLRSSAPAWNSTSTLLCQDLSRQDHFHCWVGSHLPPSSQPTFICGSSQEPEGKPSLLTLNPTSSSHFPTIHLTPQLTIETSWTILSHNCLRFPSVSSYRCGTVKKEEKSCWLLCATILTIL